MRRDSLARKRRAAFLSRADMLAQDVFKARTRHALIPCVKKQFWDQGATPDRQPSSQRRDSLLPKRKAAFLPTFAVNQNGSFRLESYIIDVEADKFGDS